MNLEHYRNQTHAQYSEQFKAFCTSMLAQCYGPSSQQAIIIAPKILDLGPSPDPTQDPSEIVDPYPNFSIRGKLAFPEGTIQIFLGMARYTQIVLSFPVNIEGHDYSNLPIYSFSLSSLLNSSFPRNVLNGSFLNTTGGMMAGLLTETYSGETVLHAIFAGLGIILIEECRKILLPLATDEDLIKYTKDMFLVFLDSHVRMKGNLK